MTEKQFICKKRKQESYSAQEMGEPNAAVWKETTGDPQNKHRKVHIWKTTATDDGNTL